MEEVKLRKTEFKYDELEGNIERCLVTIVEKLKAGQMSVMVGAGFSKNANPLYPSWYELLVRAYRKIYCKDKKKTKKTENTEKIKKLKEEIKKNPSKVAQDYVDMKGRREDLDICIENIFLNIDDKKSNLTLHEKLLSLNWNDIITTNWDTLLEDANNNEDYAVVKTAKDLKIRNCKRIIKINGSLRKSKEEKKTYSFDYCFDYLYVITEKDFNNYHIDHQDFSNFMKVKVLQDSFCLIGFSGSDPNFKYWVKELKRTMTRGGNTKEPNPIFLIDVSSNPPDKATLQYKATSQYYKNNYIIRLDLDDVVAYLEDNKKSIINESKSSSSIPKKNNDKLLVLFNYLSDHTNQTEIIPTSNYEYDKLLSNLSYPFSDHSSNFYMRKYNALPYFYFNNLYYSNDIIRNIKLVLNKIDSWAEHEYLLLYNFCINNYYSISNIYESDVLEKIIDNYKKELLPKNKALFFFQQILKASRFFNNDKHKEYINDCSKFNECKNIREYEKAIVLYENFEYEQLQNYLDGWKPEEDSNSDALTILKKIGLLLAFDNAKFWQNEKKEKVKELFNKAENAALKIEDKQILLFIKYCHRDILWKISYIEPNNIINKEISELRAMGYKFPYEYINELLKKDVDEKVKPNEDTRYSGYLIQSPDPRKAFPTVIRVFNFLEYTGIPACLCLKEIQLFNLIRENKNDKGALCQLLLRSIPFFGNSSSEELLRAIVPNILRYLSHDILKELYDKIFKIIKYKITKELNPSVYVHIITEIIKRLPNDESVNYVSYIMQKIEEKNIIVTSCITRGKVWGWKKPFIEILKYIDKFEDYKKILVWVMYGFLEDCKADSKINSHIFSSEFFPYYFQLITDGKFSNEKKEFFKSDIGKKLISDDMKYRKHLALYAYDYLKKNIQKKLVTYFEENYTLTVDPFFITKLKTDRLKDKCLELIKNYDIKAYYSYDYNLLSFVKALNDSKLLKESDKKEICKNIMEKYKILKDNMDHFKYDLYKHYIKLQNDCFHIIAELFTKEEAQKDEELDKIYTELENTYKENHSDFFEFKWLYTLDLKEFRLKFFEAITCFSYLHIEEKYLDIINTCLSKIIVQDSSEFEAVIEQFINIYEQNYGNGVLKEEATEIVLIQILNKFRQDIPFCYDDLFIKEQMKRLAKYMKEIGIEHEVVEFWINSC
jgi:hypothetical protein